MEKGGYGFCRCCGTWVQRKDMVSFSVHIFPEQDGERKEVIPLRFCVECMAQEKKELQELKWDYVTISEAEYLQRQASGRL